MVVYVCNKCGKAFKKKCNYNYHVNIRKKACINSGAEFLFSPDNSVIGFKCNTCGNIYSSKSNLTRHMRSSCNKKNKKIIDSKPVPLLSYDDNNKMNKTSKINKSSKVMVLTNFKCNYCMKCYSTNGNLNKHLKKCKVKKSIQDEREEIFRRLLEANEKQQKQINQMMKENKEREVRENKYKKNIDVFESCVGSQSITSNSHNTISNNNTLNNTINDNRTNNFQLVAFGKEDLSFISDSTCIKLLGKGYKSIPVLVKYVHFNKNNPKYHNIYISNMRDSYVITYDGEKWKLKDRNETIEQLCDDKQWFLEKKYYDLEDKLPMETRKKFNRFLNDADEDHVKDEIKGSVKLTLYNGRDMVIKQKKLIN